jgi:non-homologous end joining protein Ku
MADNQHIAWRGAVEFVEGLPPVNVALYSRVKGQRNESFKMLAPDGAPIKQVYRNEVTGAIVERDDTVRGVKTGKDTFQILDQAVIEKITEGQKTVVTKPAHYAPLDTIDLTVAINRFAVLPDDKVAGSKDAVDILWNGLLDNDLAYVTQMYLRSGTVDGLLVLYATQSGLWGALLPFHAELYRVPVHAYTRNEKAGALFGKLVKQKAKTKPFDHTAFASEYKARRSALIDAALAGEEIKVEPQPTAEAVVPDLMAMLEAEIDESKEEAVA